MVSSGRRQNWPLPLRWQTLASLHRRQVVDNEVVEAAAVSRDEVWFRYSDALGLSRLLLVDGSTPHSLRVGEGLPSLAVYMLGADHEGNVRPAAPFGLTEFFRNGHILRFTRADGLIWNDLSENGSLCRTGWHLALRHERRPCPVTTQSPPPKLSSLAPRRHHLCPRALATASPIAIPKLREATIPSAWPLPRSLIAIRKMSAALIVSLA